MVVGIFREFWDRASDRCFTHFTCLSDPATRNSLTLAEAYTCVDCGLGSNFGQLVVNCEEAIDVVTVDESENEKMRGCDEGSSPVASWDPSNSLRILLVEADDSTRYIIGALVRKCNFKGWNQ